MEKSQQKTMKFNWWAIVFGSLFILVSLLLMIAKDPIYKESGVKVYEYNTYYEIRRGELYPTEFTVGKKTLKVFGIRYPGEYGVSDEIILSKKDSVFIKNIIEKIAKK